MQFELTNNQPEEQNEIEWVKWYNEIKDEGSTFVIDCSRMSFKEASEGKQPVFYIVDEKNSKGISVFASHHPDSKFQDSTPHGIRLARAIGRAFKIEGNSVHVDDLLEAVNSSETGVSVQVAKTEKGILWTVNLA